jgi:hypothetical protein
MRPREEIKQYHLAYIKSRISYDTIDNEAISNLISEIREKDDIAYMKLRTFLLAFNGKHKEAFKLLENHEEVVGNQKYMGTRSTTYAQRI